MGFKYWWEGLVVIGGFWIIIGVPCAIIALWGSKMINDLGNFPSKSASIQVSAWWIYVVGFVSLICLAAYGAFLYNCKF